jgi:PII interaction protein X
MSETYLNHPTFGLLSRVCLVDEQRSLFTTLYAQRLFFLIIQSSNGLQFDPVTRSDAKMLVETRMRSIKRQGYTDEYDVLQKIYKRTFSQV